MRPIGLYTDSSGVHSKTARPWSTLVGDMFSSSAIGGGGILPSISARMKSSPDRPAPPATVAAWSYQVTTLDRGAPHAAGGSGRPGPPRDGHRARSAALVAGAGGAAALA